MLIWFYLLLNTEQVATLSSRSTIQTRTEAVGKLFGGDKNNVKVISIRHGEKTYEMLLTNEEYANAIDMVDFYWCFVMSVILTMLSI